MNRESAPPRLFHFSEDPHIPRFEPRAAPAHPALAPAVWAVDELHAPAYTFPRDCPRILLWRTPETTDADWRRWAGNTAAPFVAFVEWDALRQLRETALYRYALPPGTFGPLPGDPWMWVSHEPVTPLGVEPVGDLLDAIAADGTELRFVPSLAPLHGAWESTVHFSGIRLRNSRTWPPATR
ncbi:MAG: hypothetical protein IT303_13880 [Dehalococcoidia bacterium]|nr:hypothetical protein [Dehalococcoidia bacterium]